ncbi:MAG: isoaspartyl peptidase/L-asparaginase [Candidatus Thorarchaeota archaeon]|nr:isoaspartyl peptidase/L-asparaginase [Candidatus Thorarchaeota archaeon]
MVVGVGLTTVNMVPSSDLPMIVVHGGAGAWKDERIPQGVDAVREAATVGFRVLKNGASALDAAEVCTVFMEASGKLNAGVGATRNIDDEIELDAMIVDGWTLKSGSVMAVKGIQHPVSLARYVMERTEHMQFAGDGVYKLYQRMIDEGYRKELGVGVTALPPLTSSAASDTVGCITVDTKGRIACTSSTGGISKKMAGRVGDSPVFGAGAYANKTGGATATGQGEHIIRVLLSRMAVLYMEHGDDAMTSAVKAMDLFVRETHSEAGLIVADRHGSFGASTNAKAMPVTVIQGSLDRMRSAALLDEVRSLG